MNLKMDLSKKGLDMFFKDYQLEAVKVLCILKPPRGEEAKFNDFP